MNFTIKKSLLLSSVMLLAACGHQTEQQPLASNTLTIDPLVQSQALMVEDGAVIKAVSGERWLLTSASKGLLLVDKNGTLIDALPGDFEAMGVRESVLVDGRSTMLVLAVDQNNNQPQLVALSDKNQWQMVKRMSPPAFQVDNLCLFRDASDHIYAILMDGRGQSEQRLLWDGKRSEPMWEEVRQLSLPARAFVCSVDDQNQTLYVAEEDFGVWAYGANPEAPIDRELIDLQAPRGQLHGDVTGLAAYSGGVVVLDGEEKQLLVYAREPSGEHTLRDRASLSSAALLDAESLALSQANGVAQLAIVDDETGLYWQSHMNLSSGESKAVITEVVASIQTPPMDRFGDAADDPAIWINHKNATQSRVLATHKRLGLFVYDMTGKELQSFKTGRLNNVDVRYGLNWQGESIDIAAATLRDDNSLALFAIDPLTGVLSELGAVQTDLDSIYGMCMYQSPDQAIYVFANDKDGRYQQYRLKSEGGKVVGLLERGFTVASQPEGCVADDQEQQLYVGEEDVGVWIIGANPSDGDQLQPVMMVGEEIVDDVEGLGLYLKGTDRYLVISSQGNDSYVVIDADAPFAYRGRFRVGMNAQALVDGSSETDGLDVTSYNLGGEFSDGMLVVQDGRNVLPLAPQNFKYIAWSEIKNALSL